MLLVNENVNNIVHVIKVISCIVYKCNVLPLNWDHHNIFTILYVTVYSRRDNNFTYLMYMDKVFHNMICFSIYDKALQEQQRHKNIS